MMDGYFLVTNLSSISEVRNDLRMYYTDNYINTIFSGHFEEANGKLWVIGPWVGTPPEGERKLIEVKRESDTKITLVYQYEVISDYDWTTVVGYSNTEFNFVYSDGKWLFDGV